MGLALPNLDRPFRISADPGMSREEFWRFAAENPSLRMELASNGELLIMSPTHGGTSSRNSYINRVLGNWADEDNRGTVLDSNGACELRDGSVFCADAAWVSRARWVPPLPNETDVAVPCPEFVIELRSSSDRLKPLREKMAVWIANGAELAWLVDPSRKAVEIYRPGREPKVLEGRSAVEGEGPVVGFVLELGRIWG